MKKKVIKIIAAGGLAVMMGVGVLCGTVIPMNSAQANTSGGATSASNGGNLASAAQSPDSAQKPQDKLVAGEGLITPHEDDPVIGKTENGLEIRFGNSNRQLNLSNGNLAGFPYFTTYDTTNSTYYIWVIIGQNITNNSYKSSFTIIADNNRADEVLATMIAEYPSAAGAAIFNEYIGYATYNNTEIPAGGVLCLANDIVETGTANSSVCIHFASAQHYNSTYVGTMATTMDNYYTNKRFGLSKIYDKIQPVSLTTYGAVNTGNAGGGMRSTTETKYIFPLSSQHTSSSFIWTKYLTANQIKLSSTQWLRDGTTQEFHNNPSVAWNAGCYGKRYIDSNGAVQSKGSGENDGYRPAFVLKLV